MQAKFLCAVCIRRISHRDLGEHRVFHGCIHLWRLEGELTLLLFWFCKDLRCVFHTPSSLLLDCSTASTSPVALALALRSSAGSPASRFEICGSHMLFRPPSVVVADVELVTDWGGSGEGRAAGRISASTAHCTCASICVALMAASLWCFFNFVRTSPTMSLLPFFALNQALPHRFPCLWTPVSIPAAPAALHDRVCISAACRAWVLRRST
jgi:hypothetical protein